MSDPDTHTPTPGTPASGKREPMVTRYIILESVDEGVNFRLTGEKLGTSSDVALRAWSTAQNDREGLFVAVSENAFKPRHVSATIRVVIGDAIPVRVPVPADVTPPDAPTV